MILSMQAFRLNGSRVLEIDLDGDVVRAAHGAMIAYTGDVSFKSAGLGETHRSAADDADP
jgi:uncharacterized protein (AIM24 family)